MGLTLGRLDLPWDVVRAPAQLVVCGGVGWATALQLLVQRCGASGALLLHQLGHDRLDSLGGLKILERTKLYIPLHCVST